MPLDNDAAPLAENGLMNEILSDMDHQDDMLERRTIRDELLRCESEYIQMGEICDRDLFGIPSAPVNASNDQKRNARIAANDAFRAETGCLAGSFTQPGVRTNIALCLFLSRGGTVDEFFSADPAAVDKKRRLGDELKNTLWFRPQAGMSGQDIAKARNAQTERLGDLFTGILRYAEKSQQPPDDLSDDANLADYFYSLEQMQVGTQIRKACGKEDSTLYRSLCAKKEDGSPNPGRQQELDNGLLLQVSKDQIYACAGARIRYVEQGDDYLHPERPSRDRSQALIKAALHYEAGRHQNKFQPAGWKGIYTAGAMADDFDKYIGEVFRDGGAAPRDLAVAYAGKLGNNVRVDAKDPKIAFQGNPTQKSGYITPVYTAKGMAGIIGRAEKWQHPMVFGENPDFDVTHFRNVMDSRLRSPNENELNYAEQVFDRTFGSLYDDQQLEILAREMGVGYFDMIFVNGKPVSELIGKKYDSLPDDERLRHYKAAVVAAALDGTKDLSYSMAVEQPDHTFAFSAPVAISRKLDPAAPLHDPEKRIFHDQVHLAELFQSTADRLPDARNAAEETLGKGVYAKAAEDQKALSGKKNILSAREAYRESAARFKYNAHRFDLEVLNATGQVAPLFRQSQAMKVIKDMGRNGAEVSRSTTPVSMVYGQLLQEGYSWHDIIDADSRVCTAEARRAAGQKVFDDLRTPEDFGRKMAGVMKAYSAIDLKEEMKYFTGLGPDATDAELNDMLKTDRGIAMLASPMKVLYQCHQEAFQCVQGMWNGNPPAICQKVPEEAISYRKVPAQAGAPDEMFDRNVNGENGRKAFRAFNAQFENADYAEMNRAHNMLASFGVNAKATAIDSFFSSAEADRSSAYPENVGAAIADCRSILTEAAASPSFAIGGAETTPVSFYTSILHGEPVSAVQSRTDSRTEQMMSMQLIADIAASHRELETDKTKKVAAAPNVLFRFTPELKKTMLEYGKRIDENVKFLEQEKDKGTFGKSEGLDKTDFRDFFVMAPFDPLDTPEAAKAKTLQLARDYFSGPEGRKKVLEEFFRQSVTDFKPDELDLSCMKGLDNGIRSETPPCLTGSEADFMKLVAAFERDQSIHTKLAENPAFAKEWNAKPENSRKNEALGQYMGSLNGYFSSTLFLQNGVNQDLREQPPVDLKMPQSRLSTDIAEQKYRNLTAGDSLNRSIAVHLSEDILPYETMKGLREGSAGRNVGHTADDICVAIFGQEGSGSVYETAQEKDTGLGMYDRIFIDGISVNEMFAFEQDSSNTQKNLAVLRALTDGRSHVDLVSFAPDKDGKPVQTVTSVEANLHAYDQAERAESPGKRSGKMQTSAEALDAIRKEDAKGLTETLHKTILEKTAAKTAAFQNSRKKPAQDGERTSFAEEMKLEQGTKKEPRKAESTAKETKKERGGISL